MKLRTKALLGVSVGLAIAIGGVALPANAQWDNGVVESNEAAYYYSANLTNGLWDTDINTANYHVNALPYPFNLAYFHGGTCNTCLIQNNAHSLWNNKSQTGRSYYSENYGGKYDTLSGNNWTNLVNTLNNNRSWKWI